MTPRPPPDPALLTSGDWCAVLGVVGDLADAANDADGFARCGVECLPRLAASDLTTLSLCKLASGRRQVIGLPAGAIGAAARAAIGIDHAVALPVQVDDEWLVSFVFNRRGRDFSAREVARLEQVRDVASRLFRRTRALERARASWADEPAAAAPALRRPTLLTGREHEVLRWVAAGKTDRDIAAILAISHRTVHKHLQAAYAKLGVETRTAAVMRLVAPH
jgi:DNA-binding CsgD family transcriptional regulator